MRPIPFVLSSTVLFWWGVAQAQPTEPFPINVLYSVKFQQSGKLELSIFNPAEKSACTSSLNFPRDALLGDHFLVIGRDGHPWKYIGPEPSIVGRPEDLKIPPLASITTHVDLGKYYKSPSSEKRIDKVYYGAFFHSC